MSDLGILIVLHLKLIGKLAVNFLLMTELFSLAPIVEA